MKKRSALPGGASAPTLGSLASSESNASFSSAQLTERLKYRRAVEAVIWGMPAVNTELMYGAIPNAGGQIGQIIFWGKPLDWHNQTLTPNPDTLYFMGFYDANALGPMVVEIPPTGEDGSLNANFFTRWRTTLEDAGLLGIDKGKGVKFVATPPAHAGQIPEGFEQLASDTYSGYFLVRSNLARVTATPTCRVRSPTAGE
jgi:hypothetical protein